MKNFILYLILLSSSCNAAFAQLGDLNSKGQTKARLHRKPNKLDSCVGNPYDSTLRMPATIQLIEASSTAHWVNSFVDNNEWTMECYWDHRGSDVPSLPNMFNDYKTSNWMIRKGDYTLFKWKWASDTMYIDTSKIKIIYTSK